MDIGDFQHIHTSFYLTANAWLPNCSFFGDISSLKGVILPTLAVADEACYDRKNSGSSYSNVNRSKLVIATCNPKQIINQLKELS